MSWEIQYETVAHLGPTLAIPVTYAGIYRISVGIAKSIFLFNVKCKARIRYNNNIDSMVFELAGTNRNTQDVFYIQYDSSQVELNFETNVNIQFNVQLERRSEHFHDNALSNEVHNSKHLIFLSHGHLGVADDMYYHGEYLRHLLRTKLHPFILYSRSNQRTKTSDGIQICGKRAADEIREFCLRHFSGDEKIYFSIIGHSFGGIIARDCITYLFEDEQISNMLIPISLITISTPHLGIRRVNNGAISTIFNFGRNTLLDFMMGLTGRELNLTDDENEPMLLRMSVPGSKHVTALEKFLNKTAVGVTHFDFIVPHAASTITSHTMVESPQHGQNTFKIAQYSGFSSIDHASLFESDPVVFKDPIHDTLDKTQRYVADSQNEILIRYDILENLQKINWRRIHVQFGMENASHAWSGCAHVLVINKQASIGPLRDCDSSIKCCQLVMQILAIDHLEPIKEAK
jgi:hypothetical protein